MTSSPRLWDISPPVDTAAPVFPGDRAFETDWTFRIGPGCPVNVASLTLSPHTGAHADAPLHYDNDGVTAGELELTAFLGPCRVVHASNAASHVTWDDIAHATGALPPRLLIRTQEYAPRAWNSDFSALAPEMIRRLAASSVLLIGTDAPSFDPATSKDLPAHRAAGRNDIRILENLVLDDVPEGDYELIALPLKLTTSDAAPVRAVLRELS